MKSTPVWKVSLATTSKERVSRKLWLLFRGLLKCRQHDDLTYVLTPTRNARMARPVAKETTESVDAVLLRMYDFKSLVCSVYREFADVINWCSIFLILNMYAYYSMTRMSQLWWIISRLFSYQGVCCSDGNHCCPSGTSCDLKTHMCQSNTESMAISMSMTDKRNSGAAEPKKKAAIQCPDNTSCPGATTCCQMQNNRYSCCQYANVRFVSSLFWMYL